MDNDTITLLFFLIIAFCWWFKLQMDDNKQLIAEIRKQEAEEHERAERLRQLTNK